MVTRSTAMSPSPRLTSATLVDVLSTPDRREEIARMLAGETITEAARAAADDLLGARLI